VDAGIVVEMAHDPEGMPPGIPAPLQSMAIAEVSAVVDGRARKGVQGWP
jgi:hypothetical protein